MQMSNGTGRRAYLVERYVPGITWADVVDAAARTNREAVALRNAGTDLRWKSSWLIPGDEAVLCFFAADSADVVREAHRRAGVAVSRVVEIYVLSAHASNGNQELRACFSRTKRHDANTGTYR
jgi:muconolactone delta-isomerase